jgi:large subunit ribosomal protein L32e
MPAIDHRKKIKSKKPQFSAQDSHKLKRIKPRWRKPKGLQSKMRLRHGSYHSHISPGWRSPAEARGQSPQGLFPVIVHRATDIAVIDAKTHAIIVASSVSSRNKIIIYDRAKEKGITILNRKADNLPKKIEELAKQKEKARKEREEKKDSKKKKDKKTTKGKKKGKEAAEEEQEEQQAETKEKQPKKTDEVKSEEGEIEKKSQPSSAPRKDTKKEDKQEQPEKEKKDGVKESSDSSSKAPNNNRKE